LPSARLILNELKKWNVTHAVGLPDNGSRALYELLRGDPALRVVSVCREGEAYAVASGLYVGGARPFVLIQNTGFLESGDGFRGTAHNMAAPLVSLIGYRGYASLAPGSSRVDTAASFLEPTLRAWGMPYHTLVSDADVPVVSEAFREAEEGSRPVAVLLVGECA
jgi:sulfopyruvate decarboxylase TPP-binding subunit